MIAGSAAGARLLAARGASPAAGAGLVSLAAGVTVLLGLPGSAIALALPAFALMGLGVGCAAVGSTAAGTESVEPDRQGLVSGLLNTAAQLGNALGLSAFVLLAAAVPGGAAAGFRLACATAAATAVAGAAAFVALQRRG